MKSYLRYGYHMMSAENHMTLGRLMFDDDSQWCLGQDFPGFPPVLCHPEWHSVHTTAHDVYNTNMIQTYWMERIQPYSA